VREHFELKLKDGFMSELIRRAPLHPVHKEMILESVSMEAHRRSMAHSLAMDVMKMLYLKFEKFFADNMDHL
jgi:hypothetical protein